MYICGEHMCMCIPNMKFLCLNLWLGEVCTDDANNDDAQSMTGSGTDSQNLNCELIYYVGTVNGIASIT